MSEHTLTATPAMRAAVLDEAELAGLPPRVAAVARGLAMTSATAARSYIEGQRRQARAEGRPRQANGSAHASSSPKGDPGRPNELVAKTIKVTVVLDPGEVGTIAVPEGGSARPRVTIAVAGRRLTAELNPKTLRKTIANIREHGPEAVAVVLQGNLVAGDVVEAGAIIAQVKAPKPAT